MFNNIVNKVIFMIMPADMSLGPPNTEEMLIVNGKPGNCGKIVLHLSVGISLG